ncbi:MAG: class I SAM-dependent methyltransferase [Trueperaceae bacterium]
MSGADLERLVREREPYAAPARLQARIALHGFGPADAEDFHRWLWRVAVPTEALRPDARVLEVGVGSARMWRAVADLVPAGWRLTLTDRSPGMVDEARAVLAAVRRAADMGVADATALPYPDGDFDLAFANHMLYHVPEPGRAAAELRRVLRPGGRLVATTNGDGHLAEVVTLLRELATAWPDLRVDTPERLSFRLENAREVLGTAFADVALFEHAGELRVDDADALARYVASMTYAADAPTATAVVAWIRDRAERALADGPLVVRQRSGALTAT